MRLAPVPIAFKENKEVAMKNAAIQSKTTHNGQEAEECSRLLTAILVDLYHRKE